MRLNQQEVHTPSLRIARIDTAHTISELPGDFRVARGADLRRREHVLVRLTSEDGVVGFGEASPLTFFTGETAETTRFALERYLAPLTLGHEASQIPELHRRWDRAFPGYSAAKCALDLALHDLLARSAGLSVSALLGGGEPCHLPLYKAIGFGDPDRVLQEGERIWKAGLRSIKLKVGDSPATDLANLAALRDRFGDGIEISLDGNGGYAPQEAVRFLRDAESFRVAYIEQPVPGHDIEGLAFVRAHGGVPVMADESVHTLRDAYRLIQAGAVDLLGLKLIKTAGLHAARQIAALAEAFGIGCVVISPFDTELGVAAAAQLAASFPAPLKAQGLGTILMSADQRDGHLRLESGALRVPSGPGFGITPDPDVFDADPTSERVT